MMLTQYFISYLSTAFPVRLEFAIKHTHTYTYPTVAETRLGNLNIYRHLTQTKQKNHGSNYSGRTRVKTNYQQPRAATIVLKENNCHLLRVDKEHFNRILRDVEANTLRLQEHGKDVLILERVAKQRGYSAFKYGLNICLGFNCFFFCI